MARPVATVFVLAVAIAALWGAERDRAAASELVFLLQYIGSDYGVAVRDGRVVDEFEYVEMRDFSARAVVTTTGTGGTSAAWAAAANMAADISDTTKLCRPFIGLPRVDWTERRPKGLQASR